MSSDYYEILGVSKTATDQEIKKAFRKKAVELHPDRNKAHDAAEKFKKINEAYQVLSDSQKRKMYDQYGSNAFQGGGNPFGGQGHSRDMQFDFSDIFGESFDSIFGNANPFEQIFGGSRGSKPKKGEDLAVRIDITLKDVIEGPEKEIEYRRKEACSTCGGKGGEKVKQCPTCTGTGRVKQVTRSLFGNVQVVRECTDCNGTGNKIEEKCKICKGSSIIDALKKIKIRIPSGIEGGMNLRFMGEGNAGKFNIPAGDLYVEINVKKDKFTRIGDNLQIERDFPIYSLVLGDKFELETFDGIKEITITEGTDIGTIIKIVGLGVPNIRTKKRGDIFLGVKAEIPKKLSSEERDYYHKLQSLNANKKKSFWN